MATFDWNQMISNIPQTWKATRGKGAKVAILDSGADLGHPALAHLVRNGRCFWAAKLGQTDENDVTDARPRGNNHGTRCLSIMASNDSQNLIGIAPEADYYIIKVADENAAVWHATFIKALNKAIDLGVDVIVTSLTPRARGNMATEADVNLAFDAIKQKNIAFVASLRNRDDVDNVNDIIFPATRPEAIVVGSLTDSVLQQLAAGDKLDTRIDFVLPRKIQVQTCNNDKLNPSSYLTSDCPSSFANAAFGGVIALFVAHLRATEGSTYQPRSKENLLLELRANASQPLDAQAMLQAHPMAFFNNK